jgi:hypothetical protein
VATKIKCSEQSTTRFGCSNEVQRHRAAPETANKRQRIQDAVLNLACGNEFRMWRRNIGCNEQATTTIGSDGWPATKMDWAVAGRIRSIVTEAMPRIGRGQQAPSQTRRAVGPRLGEGVAMKISGGEEAGSTGAHRWTFDYVERKQTFATSFCGICLG